MTKTKIEDILAYEFIYDLNLSNNKRKLAYKRASANLDENKYETDIWIYDTKEDISYPVTETKEASIYTFDKNSDLIYKSKSKDKKDVFKKVSDHGVGKKCFEIEKEVESIKWLKKDLFLLKASEKKSEEDKKKEKDNDYFKEITTLPFWSNGAGYLKFNDSAYYFYNAKKEDLTKIIDVNFDNDISGFNLNKDLDKAVYLKGEYDAKKVMELKESLYIYDIEKQKSDLIIDKQFSTYYADFIKDKIIFVGSTMETGGINEDAFIYTCELDGSNIKKLTDDNFDMAFGNSIATDARFGSMRTFKVINDRLYFVVTEKENTKLLSIGLDGDIKVEIDSRIEDFDIVDDKIYYSAMDRDSLAQIKEDGSDKILLANKIETNIGDVEEFFFQSNGDTIRGYVLLPTKFDKDKKYPTLLSVHGGPKGSFSDVFHHEHQVFANDGYIVIYTNPHGSSGNGVKYSDIRGYYGKTDYEDLMTFVDEAIERYPQIDTDRLGVYGGSYGGFMTNWTIGHTDRFKAAVSQRCISNWTSFYGVSDIGYYFGSDQTASDPWSSLEKMWDQSPIKYADKVTTPTLFIHADEDYRCPLEQGLQMYNKLKLNGVDTKMYVFHGENHELSRSGKPKPRLKRLKEIKAWFDEYLKDEN